MRRAISLLGLAIVLAMLCGSAQAAQYRVHELGVLPGDGQSAARRINNSGQVLGYSHSYDVNDTTGIFLWSQSAGMVDIEVKGKLDMPGGINDLGQITGIGVSEAGGTAVIRGSDGSLTKLPQPDGKIGSWGLDINNAGQVVGWLHDSTILEDDHYHAVLWNINGDIITLGGGDEQWSRATDINNAGQVVWTRENMPNSLEKAYRWDKVNESVPLVLLNGTDYNAASSINDSGWIVGTSGNHAVLWITPETVVDLGTAPYLGDNLGAACGINNYGQIVGSLGGRAVLWNADGSVAADLDSFLGGEYGSGASAINDNGWVVGYRLDEYGNQQAILWEPVPEPSSILTLAGGMLCLAGLLKRRSEQLLH